jgi:hypothetical protein
LTSGTLGYCFQRVFDFGSQLALEHPFFGSGMRAKRTVRKRSPLAS